VAGISGGGRKSGNWLGGVVLCGFRSEVGGKGGSNSFTELTRSLMVKEAEVGVLRDG